MPPKKSELPGSPKIQELDEEEADESPLLPMTPESKQLAAVVTMRTSKTPRLVALLHSVPSSIPPRMCVALAGD